MKKKHLLRKSGIILALACIMAAGISGALQGTTRLKASEGYISFEYSEETDMEQIGFKGDKVSISGGSISANDISNEGNKLKLDKGAVAVKTLDNVITSGKVHFETVFLTTATSKASLFMRILNSEGEPMIDIAQYGSSNLNLYINRQTSGNEGAMAGRFSGLPVKQWAKAEVDIDLDAAKEAGHLVFDAVVWTTDNYASGVWTKFAEYDENIYLKSTTAPTATGSASANASVFDVAAIELYNAGGTNYYDDMYFEAIGDGVTRRLGELKLVSLPLKLEYNVGDSLNESGLCISGTYVYTFADGSTKEVTRTITKYDIEFDSSREGASVPVIITPSSDEKQSVSFNVKVNHNAALDYIEAWLVSFVNNKMVILEDDNSITLNKRQIKLPLESEDGVKLSWSVDSSYAKLNDRILTVIPAKDKELEIILTVTAKAKNADGDKVELSKDIKLVVPQETTGAVKTELSFDSEENINTGLKAMYDRGFFKGQESLASIENVLSNKDRMITTEELTAILVNMFEVETTYTDTIISREDVLYDKWYSDYVIAAFQLSLETKASRIEKKIYGIGSAITKDDFIYMVSRIAAIDQTTLPDDYAAKIFDVTVKP